MGAIACATYKGSDHYMVEHEIIYIFPEDEIVQAFVPDEIYGPRFFAVEPRLIKLSGGAPPPISFIPDEEYGPRFLAVMSGLHRTPSSGLSIPTTRRDWRRKQLWHRSHS